MFILTPFPELEFVRDYCQKKFIRLRFVLEDEIPLLHSHKQPALLAREKFLCVLEKEYMPNMQHIIYPKCKYCFHQNIQLIIANLIIIQIDMNSVFTISSSPGSHLTTAIAP